MIGKKEEKSEEITCEIRNVHVYTRSSSLTPQEALSLMTRHLISIVYKREQSLCWLLTKAIFPITSHNMTLSHVRFEKYFQLAFFQQKLYWR